MSAFSRFPVPFLHPVNGSGTPYPGALLYFYTAGTTTPLDTYSDLNLSVPNANPVVADANGLFGQIFLGSGTYDVVLKTSGGATIWTAEDVAAAAVSAATTTVAGIVELATTAEALTGSSAVLGMTPATVAAAIQQGFSYGTTGGSANAITVTPTVTPSALASGMVMYFRASSTNTAATTINYAGLGVVSARVMGSSGVTACGGGEIIANNVYRAVYSGSDSAWVIENVGWVPAAINNLTAETALAVGDKFLMYDISGLVPKSITLTTMTASQVEMEAGTSTAKLVTPNTLKWHDGVAKGWTVGNNWSGSGAPETPGDDSYNVTSLSDDGVGTTTVTWTTAFGSASYIPTTICQRPATNSALWGAITQGSTPTAAAVQITFASDGAAATDPTYHGIMAHGDQ